LHEVPWSAVRPRTALCHAGYGQESDATRFLLSGLLPSNWASKSKQAARKARLRLTPKGFGIEGKSEFNERGTSVTTTATARATTPPTGIDLRHALDDASVPSATGECADAPKRVIKGTQDFPRAVATTLSAVTEDTTVANQASQRCA
jgi:hypothetical protein